MTFGLKNAGATYQRTMNLIFHDLLGIILEIYIDDIVVKSDGMEGHMADLRLAFWMVMPATIKSLWRKRICTRRLLGARDLLVCLSGLS